MSKENHNVNKIYQLVDMFFDHALSNEESKNLLENVQHNPLYSRLYEQEKEFRNLIKDHVQRHNASAEFKESLKQIPQGS